MSEYRFPNDPGKWPQIRSALIDEHGAQLELFVPHSLSYFAGHFPDQPVLAGVVQTVWAERVARDCFGMKGAVDIGALKFKQMILPDTDLSLHLVAKPEQGTVTFAYKAAATQYSIGKFKGTPW